MSPTVTETDQKSSVEWKGQVSLALDALRRPDRYLVPPPEQTALDELLEVKRVIDPASSRPGSLLVTALSHLPLIFQNQQGAVSQARRAPGDDSSPAFLFAGRCAGEHRKAEVEEIIYELLGAVEGEIHRQLDEGAAFEEVINAADFGSNGIRILDRSDSERLVAGVVDSLPQDHHLRTWDRSWLLDMDGAPVIVLGPPAPVAFGKSSFPRRYYLTKSAEVWTRTQRAAQLRRRVNTPNIDPPVYSAAMETLRSVEQALPPRPVEPTPSFPPMPWGWRDRALTALEVLQFPHRHLTGPAEGAAVADLLSARNLLGVNEEDRDPNKEAARRWAALVAGEVRRQELTDLLHGMIQSIDRAAVGRIDSCILWADSERNGE